jgi:hypothetical protein
MRFARFVFQPETPPQSNWPWLDFTRTKEEHSSVTAHRINVMSSSSQPNIEENDGLESAVDQAISACGGDMRATIRALIVANEYLETEVGELMKAVSHAYARGRFHSYSG